MADNGCETFPTRNDGKSRWVWCGGDDEGCEFVRVERGGVLEGVAWMGEGGCMYGSSGVSAIANHTQ